MGIFTDKYMGWFAVFSGITHEQKLEILRRVRFEILRKDGQMFYLLMNTKVDMSHDDDKDVQAGFKLLNDVPCAWDDPSYKHSERDLAILRDVIAGGRVELCYGVFDDVWFSGNV